MFSKTGGRQKKDYSWPCISDYSFFLLMFSLPMKEGESPSIYTMSYTLDSIWSNKFPNSRIQQMWIQAGQRSRQLKPQWTEARQAQHLHLTRDASQSFNNFNTTQLTREAYSTVMMTTCTSFRRWTLNLSQNGFRGCSFEYLVV